MPVPMELSRIIISEINDQQVIYLKEIDGNRTFPILIGIFEATSIDRRVKGFPSPWPLTHDLICNVIENMGGELQDVIISELKDHTYYARLRVRQNGELIEIDSRCPTPSPWPSPASRRCRSSSTKKFSTTCWGNSGPKAQPFFERSLRSNHQALNSFLRVSRAFFWPLDDHVHADFAGVDHVDVDPTEA